MTDSKWKCPKCGGLEVQIALPAWHNEGIGHNLTYIQTDEDAEPLYWFCRACEESGDGDPSPTTKTIHSTKSTQNEQA